MKSGTAVSLIVSLLGFAELAAAQSPSPPVVLSERERAWGEQLGAALDMGTSQVRRPKVPAEGQEAGVTTWLQWEDGRTFAGITRLKFDTPWQAQEHASDVLWANEVKHDTAIEVRGDQVVVVTGQVVESPEMVKKLAAAAWKGLRAPEVPTEATVTHLRDGSRALVTTTEGPLRQHVERSLERDRALAGAPGGYTVIGPDSTLYVRTDGEHAGLHVGLQANSERATVSAGSTPEAYAAMTTYVEELRGQSDDGQGDATDQVPPALPVRAAVGASRKLDALLGN